ncbi:hypothetical protein [Thalassobaculum salexigens]|uniref:hypothetical protein n=1 Tax=Thalassobaculum salexigens TaxID=455360 RepID=UPI00248EB225|nr:hypothetical protein [Thalassobaculum salexigens]
MRTAVAFSLALALVTAASGIAYQIFLSTPVPSGDIVDFYDRFFAAGGFAGYGLADLYQWHNEHRLFLPKLWFLADIAVADARQTLLLTVIAVSAVLHAGVLAVLFGGLGHSRTAAAVAFAIAAAALLSPVQYENLLNGFQVQFVQVWLFASLAFALIAWAPVGQGRPVGLALCVIGATVAGLCSSYSMFNGLAVWPILVVLALWRRLPPAWSACLVAVGGAVLAAECLGFLNRPEGGGALGFGSGAWTILRFTLRYLTSGIGDIGTLGQEIAGIVLMVAVTAAGLRGLVRVKRPAPARMALYAVCAFVMAGAVATALGRLHIGLGIANTSRYTTPSMVFLVAAGLLGFDHLLRHRPRTLGWALPLGVVLLLVPGDVHAVRDLKDRLAARDLADLAIVSHLAGGYRPKMLEPIYPPLPSRAARVLEAMQAAGLGPFSVVGRYRPPDGALADGPVADDPHCTGSVGRLRVDPVTGVTLSATLASVRSGRRPPWMVVRSPEGRVLAWGAALEPRSDRAPIPQPGILARGLRAFGEASDGTAEFVTVEGVFDDGSRCRLPGTVAASEPTYLAELPPGARPAGTGGWTFVANAPTGGIGNAAVPPEALPVHGNFGLARRRFTAVLTLGQPGEARGVLVPLHTGRHPAGADVTLLDSGGTVLDTVALDRAVAPGWFWLALRPARLEPGMRVEIRTGVTRPSDEVAFGAPRWLP